MLPASLVDKNVQTLGLVLEPGTLHQIWCRVRVHCCGCSVLSTQDTLATQHSSAASQHNHWAFFCVVELHCSTFSKSESSLLKKKIHHGMILQICSVSTGIPTAALGFPLTFIFAWTKSSTNTRTMTTKPCCFWGSRMNQVVARRSDCWQHTVPHSWHQG